MENIISKGFSRIDGEERIDQEESVEVEKSRNTLKINQTETGSIISKFSLEDKPSRGHSSLSQKLMQDVKIREGRMKDLIENGNSHLFENTTDTGVMKRAHYKSAGKVKKINSNLRKRALNSSQKENC